MNNYDNIVRIRTIGINSKMENDKAERNENEHSIGWKPLSTSNCKQNRIRIKKIPGN